MITDLSSLKLPIERDLEKIERYERDWSVVKKRADEMRAKFEKEEAAFFSEYVSLVIQLRRTLCIPLLSLVGGTFSIEVLVRVEDGDFANLIGVQYYLDVVLRRARETAKLHRTRLDQNEATATKRNGPAVEGGPEELAQ